MPRATRLGLVAATLVAVVSGAAASGTAAAPSPQPTHPAADVTTFIVFNPIRTSAGLTLDLADEACTRRGTVLADYLEKRGDASLTLGYAAKGADCGVNAAATSGELDVRRPGVMHLALRLATVGTPKVTRQRVSKGCYASSVTARIVAHGVVVADIERAHLGTARASRLTGTLERFVTPRCEGGGYGSSLIYAYSGSSTARRPTREQLAHQKDLFSFGGGVDRLLTGIDIPGYATSATFFERERPAAPGTFANTLNFSVAGAASFMAAPDLSSASLNFASRLSSGSLAFTAGTGCPDTRRNRSGSLTGSVSIDDPVSGPLTVHGADLGSAILSDASSGGFSCPGSSTGP